MSKAILYASFIVFFLGGCSPESSTPDASVLVIENISVLDWEEGFIPNQSVLIINDRIIDVSDVGTLEIPSNATRIESETSGYLIPGLWDMHVHLTYNRALQPVMRKLFMANGVTGVRDTGGHLDLLLPLIQEIQDEPEPLTDVFFAGPLLDGEPRVYDGVGSRPDISVGLRDERAARLAVDSLVAMGVHLIKSYEMVEPDVFTAILDQAARHGIPVTGHVPLSMHAEDAAQAGLYSMEHLRNLETSCSSKKESLLRERRRMLSEGSNESGGDLRSAIHTYIREESLDSQNDDQCDVLLATLAAQQTWQIPTLTILAARYNKLYADASWRDTFVHLPQAESVSWTENAIRFSDAPVNELGVQHGAWGYGMIEKLKSAGVPILAGTDTPIFFLTPGFSLHKELAFLVAGGLTPLEALQSATLLPAQYLGLEAELGSIEPGKRADLVLLRNNPLENITNTTTIESVIKEGYLFDRESLDALLLSSAQN